MHAERCPGMRIDSFFDVLECLKIVAHVIMAAWGLDPRLCSACDQQEAWMPTFHSLLPTVLCLSHFGFSFLE